MKRRFGIIVSFILAFSALLMGLIGCKDNENPQSPTLVSYGFTVVYEDESPAENVTVVVSLSGSQVASRNTDTEGKVNFSLVANEYTVTVAAPEGFAANPITTDKIGTHQTISLFADTLQDGQKSYYVSVLSKGDTFGFKNVTVNFYQTDGSTLIRSARTDSEGRARVNLDPAQYIVKVSDLPNGWSVIGEEIKLADASATPVKYNLSASLIESSMPAGTKYTIGSVMHDFTVTLSGGDGEFTLSEALKEKDMVLINFWYIGCGPCATEFPGLNEAYLNYKNDIEIIALETYNNTLTDIETYKNAYGCPDIPMAQDNGLQAAFGAYSVPTSIVVDRNGVICYMHTGSMMQAAFESLFSEYIGEDYLTTIVPDEDEDGSSDVTTEIILPTTTFPGNDVVAELVSADGFKDTFTYSVTSNENDLEYSWPWTIEENDKGDRVFGPSNTGVGLSYSILEVTFNAKAGDALAFDYWMQVEATYDYIYVQIDGIVMYEYSINMTNSSYDSAWPTCYAYVAPADGEYTLSITFLKDEADETGIGADCMYIKNMRLVSAEIYNALDEENTFHIKRYAATNANAAATGNTPRYNNYVSYVMGADGYFHVGSANGPLLLADLMNTTPWSRQNSLWNFALAGSLVIDGQNLTDALETFAWRQNNSRLDVFACTVDFDLALLLDKAMQAIAGNSYYENMWLEVCLYYDTYGTGTFIDPIRGLDFGTPSIKVEDAPDYTEVSTANGGSYNGFYFTAEVPRMIVPRGFKYAFTPTQSGVYEIVSLGKKDTIGWIAYYDETTASATILAESQTCIFYPEVDFSDPLAEDKDTASSLTDAYNFGIRYKLEAGKTYYLLCDFGFPGETGEYRVRVSFLGENYKIFTQATSGVYTYGTQTGANGEQIQVNYMMDTLKISLGEDGYYHPSTKDLSGDETDYIYLDTRHTTYFLENITLNLLMENQPNLFDFTSYVPIGKTEAVGVDYTAKMQEYLATAETDTTKDTYGCVKLDKELYEIMLLFVERYARLYDYPQTQDNVLAMCMYYTF